MKIEGSYTMDAPREAAYAALSDPAALQHCLPGCEKFEQVGEGRYETVLKAGVAGIRGTFTGTVTMTNQQPPDSYTLSVEGSFSGGFVKGTGDITLEDESGKTRVKYNADGQVGGPLASVGQRLIGPATKMIAGQFFRCMEGQVKNGVAEAGGQASQ
ncbi:MAG TPA: carbon monoxide dehydrogenase subunit G [Thermomicrobiales bacterium]|nr:carbon monoxide dehydrogenase subunit G [Thermomicrobiales bacterium]